MTDPFSLILGCSLIVAVMTVQRPVAGRKRIDAALCDAASIGDLRAIKRLLADGVSEDSADEDGMTALMAASFCGQVKAVQALLDAGADPDTQDVSGTTALMNAVLASGEMDQGETHPIFFEIVELLLDADADVEIEDEDGLTARDHALAYSLMDAAERLAER